ncbi:MAG6410 family transglutaminase-related lipoprotein [Ureaplasma diversum]|uniref:Transglutaminase-like domain-containing protein n=1 Tax=Ureaplasma diversum NCTC 246 TaxID=1188241 RepID=A0A084EVR9_9BACT|nr:transglutaminase domain-containing protein [Ureaplasma diversum]KEZ22061.1 Hypothetical protein, predicted lipoprotein [Ureaplasma diversum NCTC 246]
MKTKKKIIISSLLIGVGLLPIIGFVASCKNEDKQGVNQKHSLLEELDERDNSNSKKKNSQLFKETDKTKISEKKQENKPSVLNNQSSSPATGNKQKPTEPSDQVNKKPDDKSVVGSNNSQPSPNNSSSSNSVDNKKEDETKNQSTNPLVDSSSNQPKEEIQSPFDSSTKEEQPLKHVDDSFYPKQIDQPVQPAALAEQQIRDRILGIDQLAPNYYTHSDFKLKNDYVEVLGDGSDPFKLELLDKDNQPVSGVKWYVRTRYPESEVYKSGSTWNGAIISLKDDGTVSGLKYDGEQGKSEVWAEYQGYLYKAIVRVFSNSETENEIETRKAKEAAKKITEEWHDLSDYQKALKAYEWMTQNVEYVERGNLVDDQTAYSSLVEKRCVCSGYAKGYKMLLDELGIPSKLIVGPVLIARNTYENHIWNLVEIEGKWYHVDTTWGVRSKRWTRNGKQKTIYNYFLILDDDFRSPRKYTNPNLDTMGTKYRASKMDNFVVDEIGVRRVIHKTFTKEPKRTWFLVNTPWKFKNEEILEKAIKDLTGTRYKPNVGRKVDWNYNFKYFWYLLEDQIKNVDSKKVDLTISPTTNDKSSYIIKIQTNGEVEFGLENIEVQNAFIDRLEKTNDGYLVYLTNFDIPNGKNNIKIDVFKIGYQFKPSTSEVSFDVKQQPTPEAKFIADTNSSGVLTNVDSNMQYRTTIGDWKDIQGNSIPFNDVGTIDIYVRRKPDAKHSASKIQHIKLTKGRDLDREVKYYNKQIIGVDNTMQYRLDGTADWKEITTTKLSNLSSGTYQVRIKPNGSQLASDTVKVTVY